MNRLSRTHPRRSMAHMCVVRLDGGACSSVGYGPATDASVSAQPSEGHYIRRLGGLLAIRPAGERNFFFYACSGQFRAATVFN